MMKDLKYRVERPQYLRMTLEDCSMCLTNFNDPVFSSVAVSQIQAGLFYDRFLVKTFFHLHSAHFYNSQMSSLCMYQNHYEMI